ncbi:hypothetical protein BU26DRAFT_522754 [Trematosphaeria pertusa]|uniref:Uncharacterized protein n=1 Tax=Trematosphaeria pertusa TaxID=390896 RepID=A0A6A6I233_9PLEO|nr:uncharacterized protein BU26DRAFT_522754 [Trematosphaeria pertusa]KAF2244032.1 hypothetical protein BU26DRAFT_522754 [Trematosphaeria pertusa]
MDGFDEGIQEQLTRREAKTPEDTFRRTPTPTPRRPAEPSTPLSIAQLLPLSLSSAPEASARPKRVANHSCSQPKKSKAVLKAQEISPHEIKSTKRSARHRAFKSSTPTILARDVLAEAIMVLISSSTV